MKSVEELRWERRQRNRQEQQARRAAILREIAEQEAARGGGARPPMAPPPPPVSDHQRADAGTLSNNHIEGANNSNKFFPSSPDVPSPVVAARPAPFGSSAAVPKTLHWAFKASPASSVSLSQSPEKQRNLKPAAVTAASFHHRILPAVAHTNDDDLWSSDDEENAKLLAAAKRRIQEKAVAASTAAVASRKSSESHESSNGRHTRCTTTSDGGSVVRTAAAATMGPPSDNTKKRARHADNQYFSSSDDEEDDARLRALARARLDADRREEERREVPRNPLQIMKRERLSDEAGNNSHPYPDSNSSVPNMSHNEREELEERLWADDGDDADNALRRAENRVKRKKPSNARLSPTKQRNSPSTSVWSASATKLFDGRVESPDELKPYFADAKFGPFDNGPLQLSFTDEERGHAVPSAITRYLLDYQLEGIQFMYRALHQHSGAILGDDMGLGKTVQTVALLAALLGKTGTIEDVHELNRRQDLAKLWDAQQECQLQEDLRNGRPPRESDTAQLCAECRLPSESWPILVVVPPTVVNHWCNDIDTWGHFSFCSYGAPDRDAAIRSIKKGAAEIMIVKSSMITRELDLKLLLSIPWKVVVVDEFHKNKNPDGRAAINLNRLRYELKCKLIGLTGTLMQNDHKELHTLISLVVPDLLGSWQEFDLSTARPIKLGRAKDADAEAVALGDVASREFSNKLYQVYLHRTKEEKLAGQLPSKDERIIFCEPSELQKRIYKHILDQPDFRLLRFAPAPCDCGVNRKFFMEYKALRTVEQRIAYQRHHAKDIVKQSKCCRRTPIVQRGSREIDPNAILWRQLHAADDPQPECDNCPSCILLSALSILYKLSSHVALLQLESRPGDHPPGSRSYADAIRKLDRLKVFLPADVLPKLPGGYFRATGIMDDHFALSGKIRVLHKLLHKIDALNGRALLFSASTQCLDLIEHYIKSQGYSSLRMDGTTSEKQRVALANEFRNNPSKFIFLLSTRAMGLGLTLVEANYVIIFDVEWNPSNDEQAQDRAYRIGQKRDVTVFRLVAQGTIEEQKYLRQVYKVHLKNDTIIGARDEDVVEAVHGGRLKPARLFRGVAGDNDRKGELFGMSNLLKFNDGPFMSYSARKTESARFGVGVHSTADLIDDVENLDDIEREHLCGDGLVFDNLAKQVGDESGAVLGTENAEDEASLAGESQAIHEYCEYKPKEEQESSQSQASSAHVAVRVNGISQDRAHDERGAAMVKGEKPTLSPVQEAEGEDSASAWARTGPAAGLAQDEVGAYSSDSDNVDDQSPPSSVAGSSAKKSRPNMLLLGQTTDHLRQHGQSAAARAAAAAFLPSRYQKK